MVDLTHAAKCARSYYHRATAAYQRTLITTALVETGNSTTHAARALGLQRTYLLRLIRARGIVRPVTS